MIVHCIVMCVHGDYTPMNRPLPEIQRFTNACNI